MLKSILSGVMAVILLAGSALAQSFTAADVENLIRVSQELKGMEDKYPDLDVQLDTSDPDVMSKLIDKDGNIRMMTYGFQQIPKGSAPHKEATRVIKKNGFSSVSDFTSTGDQILLTMVSIELAKQDMSSLDQMTPDMMAMMPPNVRAQIASVKMMVKAADAVPEADKAVLRPLLPQLEAAFNNE